MSNDNTGQDAKSLFESNQKLQKSFEKLNNTTSIQVDIAMSMNKIFSEAATKYKAINDQTTKFSTDIQEINEKIEDFIPTEAMKKFMDALDENAKRYSQSINTLADNIDSLSSAVNSIEKSSNIKSKETNKILKNVSGGINNASMKIKGLWDSIKGVTKIFKKQEKIAKAIELVSKTVEVGLKGIASVMTTALGFLPGLFKVVTNFAGLMARFIKTVLSLPMMLATAFAEIGGKWRNDIIVTLGQAIENTQELFSETSNIGKGIQNMSKIGKGMFLEFINYGSDAVKLFDEGAAGIANMYKETTQIISDMGQYSEIFGGAVTKSKESIFFLTKLKRAFGLEASNIAFYAQDAGINLESVSNRIYNAGMTIAKTAKEYNIDMKRLSNNFNELRDDIVLFGHLSDNELVNTAARMTHLKVSTKDLTAVFTKFSTFEDAANSVALLSQTFGMNLNAMDIIKAENPGDIIDMFRNAMLETGKSFEDMSRFEKQILADQTGMSYESLKAMMTFRDIGYTHQEALEMIKDQSPEEQQKKALKGLNSSINELQKVLNRTSPFDAFFDGLANNLKISKGLRETFMSLSEGYEGIYKFALNLDTGTVQRITEPIKIILRIMNNILNSEGFKTGFKTAVGAIGSLAMNVFGITDSEKVFHVLSEKIKGFDTKKGELLKKDLKNIVSSKDESKEVKDLIKGVLEKQGNVSGNFLDALNEMKEKAKEDTGVKKAYNEFMSKFQNTYKLSSMVVKGKDSTSDSINILHESLRSVINTNKGSLSTYFDLSGNVMGAIVKGAATIGISLIHTITDAIDDIYKASEAGGNSKRSVLETLFDWEAGDLSRLAESFGAAIGDLFKQGGTFFSVGGWIVEQMALVLTEVATTFANLLWFSLKEMFGFSESSMSIQNIQWSAQEKKQGFTSGDLGVKYDSDYSKGSEDFSPGDFEWKASTAIRMQDVKESLTSKEQTADTTKLLEAVTQLQKEQREGIFDEIDQKILVAIEKSVDENLELDIEYLRSNLLKEQIRPDIARNKQHMGLANIKMEDGEIASPFTVINEDGSINTVSGQTGLLSKPGGYYDNEIDRTSRVVEEAGQLQSSIRDVYLNTNFSSESNKKQTVEKMKSTIAEVNKLKESITELNLQTTIQYTPIMLAKLKSMLLDAGLASDMFNPLTCKSDVYLSPDALVSRSGQTGRHGEAATPDYVQYKRG